MANTDRQYDKTNSTAYISRSVEYIKEDGTRGTETEIFKKVYGGKHFWRVWLSDLLTALGLVNNSRQLDVVFYILENANPSNNLYIGTIRATAEVVGVSVKTVATTFKKLKEADIITQKQSGVYMIQPTLMIKGDDRKQHRLIIQYEDMKQNQAGQGKKENEPSVDPETGEVKE